MYINTDNMHKRVGTNVKVFYDSIFLWKKMAGNKNRETTFTHYRKTELHGKNTDKEVIVVEEYLNPDHKCISGS